MFNYHYVAFTRAASDEPAEQGQYLTVFTVVDGVHTTTAAYQLGESGWNPHQADAMNTLVRYEQAVNATLGHTGDSSLLDLAIASLNQHTWTAKQVLDRLAEYARQYPLIMDRSGYTEWAQLVHTYAPNYGAQTPIPIWTINTPSVVLNSNTFTNLIDDPSRMEDVTHIERIWFLALALQLGWAPEPGAQLPAAPAYLRFDRPHDMAETLFRFLNAGQPDKPQWAPANPASEPTSLPSLDHIPDGATVMLDGWCHRDFDLITWASTHNITFIDGLTYNNWGDHNPAPYTSPYRAQQPPRLHPIDAIRFSTEPPEGPIWVLTGTGGWTVHPHPVNTLDLDLRFVAYPNPPHRTPEWATTPFPGSNTSTSTSIDSAPADTTPLSLGAVAAALAQATNPSLTTRPAQASQPKPSPNLPINPATVERVNMAAEQLPMVDACPTLDQGTFAKIIGKHRSNLRPPQFSELFIEYIRNEHNQPN